MPIRWAEAGFPGPWGVAPHFDEGLFNMLTRSRHICAFLAAVLILAAPLCFGAAGGEKKGKGADQGLNGPGPVEFILDHQKDLNLDATQVSKLTDIQSKISTQKEKLKQDPEIRDLYRAAAEAKASGDQEAVRAARKKMREAIEKKSGLKFEEVMADALKVLHPDQQQKLAELRKKSGLDANPMQTLKGQKNDETADANHQKPDVAKGAPSLYDDN